MPLHVFIAQSASVLTGGIEVWKAAKDVLLFLSSPALLYISWRRGLWRNKTFQTLLALGAVYALLHGLYLLFDKNDDTYSTILASVYNTRLLIYLLLGYVVGTAKSGERNRKYLMTAMVLIAGVVAVFGLLQYFILPHDFLTHFGYSLERGVKPLFFIDDKPDLPRIMSTLKDPNSLGAYLILPLLTCLFALVKSKENAQLFIRPLRREVLVALSGVMAAALVLTFSRGALLAAMISAVTILYIVTGEKVYILAKKYWVLAVVFGVIVGFGSFWMRNTYLVQNVIFHADESTVLADPNELRVQLAQRAVEEVLEDPLGHGPGTAGLVSITNPKGGLLTENYYLQIAYEIGWLGVLVFIGILVTVALALYAARRSAAATVLCGSLAGYAFYSLLIHLWSNEAVALQWWLLTGAVIGGAVSRPKSLKTHSRKGL